MWKEENTQLQPTLAIRSHLWWGQRDWGGLRSTYEGHRTQIQGNQKPEAYLQDYSMLPFPTHLTTSLLKIYLLQLLLPTALCLAIKNKLQVKSKGKKQFAGAEQALGPDSGRQGYRNYQTGNF